MGRKQNAHRSAREQESKSSVRDDTGSGCEDQPLYTRSTGRPTKNNKAIGRIARDGPPNRKVATPQSSVDILQPSPIENKAKKVHIIARMGPTKNRIRAI